MRIRTASALILLVATATIVQAVPEKPVSITDRQVAESLKTAPPCPAADAMGLKLRPIDYIDCANPADPHDFLDQGTSSITTGPAGTYRITAAHRHAFFAYRFRSAGKDKPILIVFEYPDDAKRTINFSTHESVLTGRSNSDWSLETGVYTGEPFPLSNQMQYHTFIMWPQDEWPVALVGNFHRYGHPAAAGKIWVFAIEGGLPKLEVDAPEPSNQRQLSHFTSFAFLPTSFYFGAKSPNAVEHMLDYAQYIGVNQLAWVIAANNGWGVWADIPSLPSTDSDRQHLDRVLAAMDKREGMSFIGCMGTQRNDKFVFGGKNYLEMTPDQLRAATIKLFDEFIDRYGKYKSLKGIGLGSQYNLRFYKRLQEAGVTADVVAHIKARRPDLEVMNFAGGQKLHRQYFSDAEVDAESVYAAFEAGDAEWSDVLAAKANECWRLWKQDPAEMQEIPGLTVYEQYQPDDYRIYGLYSQQPREAMYFDLDDSQARSDLVDSHYAAMWNTHYEGWYGLHPDVNFWYQKLWVAPDFNAPHPMSLASFARIMGHRDRLAIMPGSWNHKYFGYETAIRRFAKAFRSLPPVPMIDVENVPLDTVKVRWLLYGGKRYISLQSLIPVAGEVAIDGTPVALGPYELVALCDDSDAEPVVTGKAPDTYAALIGERVHRLRGLIQQVRELDPEAAPDAYSRAADRAAEQLTMNQPRTAELTMGVGLINELQLRKDIINPPTLTAPRLTEAPPMTGDLDAWPAAASDLQAEDGKYLAGHLYFPNSWSGPDDLSARLRFGHDGEKLYVAAEIRDNKIAKLDGCHFRLSTNGAYLDWTGKGRKSDLTWLITLPGEGKPEVAGKGGKGFTYACRRTPTGYVVEGSAPLAELGLAPGDRMGFLLNVTDDDDAPNRYSAGWARKQVLLVPHQPNFVYWSDVRNCGSLVLGE